MYPGPKKPQFLEVADDMVVTKTLYGTICEMVKAGVTRSSKQSEYLEKEYGFAVPKHVLAEYKWLKQYRGASTKCVIETELAWANKDKIDKN
jgi:hypothetical protein